MIAADSEEHRLTKAVLQEKKAKAKAKAKAEAEAEADAEVLALAKELKPGDGGDETKAMGEKKSSKVRLVMPSLSPLHAEGGDETKRPPSQAQQLCVELFPLASPADRLGVRRCWLR